jgi:hypothetical protein
MSTRLIKGKKWKDEEEKTRECEKSEWNIKKR